jgi:hypothetical protein
MTDTSNDDVSPILPDSDLRDEIERRAYFKFCERGCGAGRDVEDWLNAEREVVAERALPTRDAQSHKQNGPAKTLRASRQALSVEPRKNPASGGKIPQGLGTAQRS